MSTLAEFQRETSLALNDPALVSPQTASEKEPGGHSRRFNIYRNNRAASLVNALRSTYPVLCKLTGESFFRSAARQFIDLKPPTCPVLSEYGKTFGQFVQALPGATDFPYLSDVAKLEWYRLQSYHSTENVLLTMNDLSQFSQEDLLSCSLTPHAASRLVESNWAIGQLWSSVNTSASSMGAPVTSNKFRLDQPEAILVSRPRLDVKLHILNEDSVLFFKPLLAGRSIVESATNALASRPDFNTGAHLQALISFGAFTAISL